MAVVFKDTFTDVDGTRIIDHVPDLAVGGLKWELEPSGNTTYPEDENVYIIRDNILGKIDTTELIPRAVPLCVYVDIKAENYICEVKVKNLYSLDESISANTDTFSIFLKHEHHKKYISLDRRKNNNWSFSRLLDGLGGSSIFNHETSDTGEITIRFKVEDRTVFIYIDDELAYTETEPEYTYGATKIGLSSYSNSFFFDSIEVETIDDETPPSEIIDLAETHDSSSVNLSWQNPTDSDFSHVNIYNDDELIGTASDGIFEITDLESNTEYEFTLKTVDFTGNESTGISITIKTNIRHLDVLFRDTFTSADETLLINHVPDISQEGFGWRFESESDGENFVINDGKLTSGTPSMAFIDVPVDNYVVTMDIGLNSESTVSYRHNIYLKYIDSSNYLNFAIRDNKIRFTEMINGTSSGWMSTTTINTRSTATLELIYSNGWFAIYIDNEHMASKNIGSVLNTGSLAVKLNTTDSIDNLEVRAIDTGLQHGGVVTDIVAKTTDRSVELSWKNPTSGSFLGVSVIRNGTTVKYYTNDESYRELGLTPSTTYVYEFSSLDYNGRLSNKVSISVTTDDLKITPKSPPVVNILSIDRAKLSEQPNMNRAMMEFKFGFDQDIQSWQIRVNGSSHETGVLAVTGGYVRAGTEAIAEISSEFMYTEGENRINIYGQGLTGVWTPYNDERPIVMKELDNRYGTGRYGSSTYGKH